MHVRTGLGRRLGSGRQLVAVCLALVTSTGALAALPAPQPLPGLTAKEANADAVWTLRAGLNVAALQCQFSPFLATVPTYNALLRQHSDELADAFKVMTGYFVRLKGPKAGQRMFDSYATRTNQNWATFDAQYSFCGAAAMTGRRALAVPKGKFGEFASTELGLLRKSLEGTSYSEVLAPRLEWAVVPTLKDPCPGREGRACR
jgi:hypothetical protein